MKGSRHDPQEPNAGHNDFNVSAILLHLKSGDRFILPCPRFEVIERDT